jgi:hypothetical protein
MGRAGFRLVIEKPKVRLTFAPPTRVKPGKKQDGRRCRTRKSSPLRDL